MADICTAVTNVCAGGGHGDVTINGETTRIDGYDEPTAEDIATARRVGLWKLRQKGVTLAQLVNRVVIGEEATNVKSYTLIAPGVEIAKSNVGVTPQNALPGSDGQAMLVDFTGCTEFRPVMAANIGSGTWALQLIRDDDTVLYTSPNLSMAGEQSLDPGWQPLPVGFDGLAAIRIRCGSGGSAEATFRRAVLVVR